MKFNDDSSNYPITIQFQLYSDHLILRVTNSINEKNTTKFQLFINELLRNEPQDLFLRQMKRAEKDTSMTTSRLGLLTMIDSYNAKLGWKFETVQQIDKAENLDTKPGLLKKLALLLLKHRLLARFRKSGAIVVTTMAQLTI